jgi:hypothetical protein
MREYSDRQNEIVDARDAEINSPTLPGWLLVHWG